VRARLYHYFPSIPALALYLATVVSEVPVIFTRMIIILIPTTILIVVRGGSPNDAWGYTELALIPTGWAILALITPLGGGWWWRTTLGGREPSTREQEAYKTALDELRAQAPRGFREPASWFVLDTPHPDASVCGNALALSRGLLETPYLTAVLAHELGHLNTSDGRLTAALNRLLINPISMRERERRERQTLVLADNRLLLTITLVGIILWTGRKILSFACGGFGLRLLGPFWGSYWREREYLADHFAADLGQAEDLADFLETHALMHDQPVPLIWLTEHTHPPTELRVDHLRAVPAMTGAAVAEAPEPVNGAPAGPPPAGPDGPPLTEPDTSTGRSLTTAGQALPRTSQRSS